MPVLAELDPQLDFEEFERRAGQALQHETIRATARRAVEAARRLCRPAIAYEWLPVHDQGPKSFGLGPIELHPGSHANLMQQAVLAVACVCTIGRDLEDEAKQMIAAGQTLEGYLLGEAGVLAVDTAMGRVRLMAEQEAAGRGWGVGAELAPGQLAGWRLTDQKLLCSLLDLASIGVTLTDSGMLQPQKSASLLIGIGPGYTSSTVISPCEFCSNRDTCSYRH